VDELLLAPAHEQLRRLRDGELAAETLLEAHLARIERLNPALNAVVALDPDGARRRARELDRAHERGDPPGPLHGLPITIKDLYDVAGLPVTCGHPRARHNVVSLDAVAVARLRRAGAVIMGKTNVPFVGYDWQSANPVYGRTSNPWDPARTCGGSSGGAAAAVAAGLSAFELGSDMGGSIRVPASFCGVVGLKATEGWLDDRGHGNLPWLSSRVLRHLCSLGPVARTVRDARLVFEVLAEAPRGYEPVPPVPLERPAEVPLERRRFRWCDALPGLPVDGEIRQAVADLAGRLERAGCTVERAVPDIDPDEAIEVWGAINGTEFGAAAPAPLRRLAWAAAGALFGDRAWARGMRRGLAQSPARYFAALTRRDELVERLDRFLEGWDGWLLPVAGTVAFTHRRIGTPIEIDGRRVGYATAAGSHAALLNTLAAPAVALPVALTRGGLPIGVQLVGRRWHDMALLDAAEQIEELAGGLRPPPLAAPAPPR
jgi:amidase